MGETEILTLSNAILSLLLILSEFMGWSNCSSNSISEIIVNLFKSNKCAGGSNTEEDNQIVINTEPEQVLEDFPSSI